jgi:hypothetical protein
MKRSVTVWLSEFSAEALARGDGPEHVPARLIRAIHLYLGARDSGRPGWSVPSTLREREPRGVELELVADEDLWRAFEQEAGKQGVSVSRLAGQAAIYYAAELDAGRVTQRILDDSEDESD